MSRRIMSDSNISSALKCVKDKIKRSYDSVPLDNKKKFPLVVAASKFQPKELIIEAYNNGQRHFGENYIKELLEKSKDASVLEQCMDIKWHFIGHVQSNKVPKLLSASNLHMVETVHSVKVANMLNSGWKKLNLGRKLQIMIQVNTSGEINKNGIEPSETVTLVSHILQQCPELEFRGLMTIGALGRSIALPSDKKNEDFVNLINCQKTVCDELNLDYDTLDLSMGMSSDFEHAIEMGSTMVRIGRTIFGDRPKKSTETTGSSNVVPQSQDEGTQPSTSDIVKSIQNVNLS